MASGVVSLARPALAQMSGPLSADQPPQAMQYEGNVALTEGHSRLEEMKVQLALLADIATFPYYLGARAVGENLTVTGYVPNERVQQRALELARQHTFLRVADGLRIQGNLSLRPPLRPAEVLQKEGAELLVKNLGESGRQIQLQARPNGLIVLSGSVASVEEKVEISRLFRQLGGCSGVVNDLTVQTMLRDGQRVMAVTKDGMQTVAPSAGNMDVEPSLAPPVTPGPIPGTWKAAPLPHKEIIAEPRKEILEPRKELPVPHKEMETPAPVPPREPAVLPPPQPTQPPPTPSSRNLDAHEGELTLPIIKSGSALPPPAKSGARDNTLPDIKNLSSTPGEQAPASTPPAKPKPSAMSWESETPASTTSPKIITITPPDEKLSNAGRDEAPKIKKGKLHKSDAFATDSAAPTHGDGTADALTAPTPPMSWRRPGSWEASEAPAKAMPPAPATPAAPKPSATPPAPASSNGGVTGANFEHSPAPLPAAAPTTPATPATPPAPAPASRPVRRWPPAYEVKPPQDEAGHAGTIEFDEGRTGTIEFEDEPPANATPASVLSAPPPAVPRTPTQDLYRSVVPDNLKKQVKAVCGRQAKDVTAVVQPDASVLVTVKVTKAAEKQVIAKILTIPEMNSSKVRLSMDIVP
jgi:hypothetical protein